ncbi:MAG: BlaB/IND/MUS family subclass B1 metallo-beta-lactamase [Ginsengibacter sp.]
MKNYIYLFVLIFYSLNSFGQAKSYLLEITHLKDGFYVYVNYGTYNNERYPANAMYLVTDKGVILFDTPWGESYYQPLLDSIWKKHHQKVIMCISTHFHKDRTGGLKYYRSKGIKTYTTYKTDSLSKINHQNRAQFLMAKDTTFHIGGYFFQTYYPGPGHTIDNIAVLFPNEKIVYGGCFIKSTEDKTPGNLEDADVKEWGNSLKNLQQKMPNPEYVIPGHNDWKNKNSLQHTFKLVEDYNNAHP